jgi:hypothetical protein
LNLFNAKALGDEESVFSHICAVKGVALVLLLIGEAIRLIKRI